MDSWAGILPHNPQLHASQRIDCAHSELGATGSALSGDYGTVHSSTGHALQPPSHFPIDVEPASVGYTSTGSTDAPIIVYGPHPASDSPNHTLWGLDAASMPLVTDSRHSFLWSNPDSQQPLWHYPDAGTADVGGNPSTAPYMAGETSPVVDSSWNVPRTHGCVPQPCRALSAVQQVAYHYSYATTNPSVLVYRFPDTPVVIKEHPQEEHFRNTSADVLGLPSSTEMPVPGDQASYLGSSSKLSLPTPSIDIPLLPPPTLFSSVEHDKKDHRAVVSTETPTVTKARRRQSTEKVFPCEWPGCNKCKSPFPALI